mmetsp:Transcript_22471/g.52929  ORF Transcript_22471/g.52929 Transcript_22471/m.52929 type:complete len:241 (+) Transcript_22471:1321-2043(+)
MAGQSPVDGEQSRGIREEWRCQQSGKHPVNERRKSGGVRTDNSRLFEDRWPSRLGGSLWPCLAAGHGIFYFAASEALDFFLQTPLLASTRSPTDGWRGFWDGVAPSWWSLFTSSPCHGTYSARYLVVAPLDCDPRQESEHEVHEITLFGWTSYGDDAVIRKPRQRARAEMPSASFRRIERNRNSLLYLASRCTSVARVQSPRGIAGFAKGTCNLRVEPPRMATRSHHNWMDHLTTRRAKL